ncbi:uncharacterized protein LOC110837168 [Zootermopsis nevadensis]|uniref:uncharacterized protein LOC110837168 n=1 Tax=Zootermopsis nevadensis TaxID=136037 RepID=UPI000B8E39C5|nr:uncharacterized protein LOC110837168 [Zootermopsis nevadensis]XP_021934834.1 uncharacterized protein LOC110837168 [Zootermopsis nevadensis]
MKNVHQDTDSQFVMWVDNKLHENVIIYAAQRTLEDTKGKKDEYQKKFKLVKGIFELTVDLHVDLQLHIENYISRIKALIAPIDENLEQIQDIIDELHSTQSIIVTARLDAVTSIEEAKGGLKFLFGKASFFKTQVATTDANYDNFVREHQTLRRKLEQYELQLAEESEDSS